MARPAKFDGSQILDCVREIVALDGPSAATIGAIARAVRAPTGSIYHRFESREVLLGEVWLRAAEAFQDAYFEVLSRTPARDAGLAAALYLVERVRTHLPDARVLHLHRREDFIDRGWPRAMERRARRLKDQVDRELRDFCRRLCGRADPRTLRLVTYAVLDAPLAAVRRHVAANEAPPAYLDLPVTATYRAVLSPLSVLGEDDGGGVRPEAERPRRRRS